MTLIHFMNDTPLWVVAVIVAGLAELYAVGLLIFARRVYGLEHLRMNNEVAGFKFAVVGVLYAVLLAFVVVAVWEDFRNTETAVRDEAKAAVDLHRVTHALPPASKDAVHETLMSYLHDVRDKEWPAMGLGAPSQAVADDLNQLSHAIFELNPEGAREAALYAHALRLLTVISDNRDERIDSADGSVPTILWITLIVGAAVTLGYPAFFGAENSTAQALMTASLAILVALALVLALALDYPFTGDLRISAKPFDEAIQQIPDTYPPR